MNVVSTILLSHLFYSRFHKVLHNNMIGDMIHGRKEIGVGCWLLPMSKTTNTSQNVINTHSKNKKWNNMFWRLAAYQKQHQTTYVPKKGERRSITRILGGTPT